MTKFFSGMVMGALSVLFLVKVHRNLAFLVDGQPPQPVPAAEPAVLAPVGPVEPALNTITTPTVAVPPETKSDCKYDEIVDVELQDKLTVVEDDLHYCKTEVERLKKDLDDAKGTQPATPEELKIEEEP